jgi:phage-related protein
MWNVIYYETAGGECPVRDFIESRTKRNQAKILALLELLEERGPNLPRPYADLLEHGIHELRIRLSGDQIRILYFFCFQNFIVLTNCLAKRTERVPSAAIAEARRCREDFLDRMTETGAK